MGTRMRKLRWIKFGWSEYYRGGLVDGNFGWLNANRGQENAGRGHEAFNFMPFADGKYRCYVPPQAKHYPPWNEDNTAWTVVCLAKDPKRKGIHVVGWYENATFLGEWEPSNGVGIVDGHASHCTIAHSEFLIPPEKRTKPFSDPSVRQGKFSFLSGPGVKVNANKQRVLRLLNARVATLRPVAVRNPDDSNAPSPESDASDPLFGFGTAEHRREVELKAEDVVVAHYGAKGFEAERVADRNCGWDFIFKKGQIVYNVEVKGTSGAEERLFLTRNEFGHRLDDNWRLAMVTNALGKRPKVKIYKHDEFDGAFDLEPLVYLGRRIIES